MLARRMFVSLVAAAALASCESGSRDAAPQAPAVESAAGPTRANALTRVEDASQVCMVNNQFMGKPQIPVEVGGKTYYGCCEMCKGRLQTDAAARTATDPVTGETVDKATAVIAQDATGAVLYFANADHLARYKATL